MFGGIAAAGVDRLLYATHDGNAVFFHADESRVVAEFSLAAAGPRDVRLAACAADADGTLLFADVHHGKVRRYTPEGRQVARYGARANPGLRQHDEAGVLAEPCAILPLHGEVIVCCGGAGLVNGVQRFSRDGSWRASFPHPGGPRARWERAQGIARVDDALWVAETEAGAIRRFRLDGTALSDVPLGVPPDVRRPFRVAHDGYEAVLMLLAAESRDEQRVLGVARLDLDGEFLGWAVKAGDEAGSVLCPFDLAVLPDGRFAVADLPLGVPPDVRIQVFGADGRLERVVIEDVVDMLRCRFAHHERVLARPGATPDELYAQGRVRHEQGGGLEDARALYREALAADPGHLLARMELGRVEEQLGAPREAETEYRRAIEAGGDEADLLARIAECRRRRGDLDGAIRTLESALEREEPPEDYHARVEELGSYYLERAGESP